MPTHSGTTELNTTGGSMTIAQEVLVVGGVIAAFAIILLGVYGFHLLRQPPGARARLWHWFDGVMEVERLR
jgi:hypothetical protein